MILGFEKGSQLGGGGQLEKIGRLCSRVSSEFVEVDLFVCKYASDNSLGSDAKPFSRKDTLSKNYATLFFPFNYLHETDSIGHQERSQTSFRWWFWIRP